MTENIIIAFNAVAPMFLTILLGYVIGRCGMLDHDSITRINGMLFNTLFPLIVVCNLYGTSVREALDVKLITYSVSIGIALWLVTIPIVMKIEKNNATRGAMIQAINRSNFLVIGFPIVGSICADEDVSAAALTIVGVLLVNNVMSVIVLEVFRGSKPDPAKIIRGIVKNPIILATIAGLLMMVTELRLPTVLEKTMYSLGDIATPLALIIVGASLDLKSVGRQKRNLAICVAGKLVVVPAIVAFGGLLLGFRGMEFVTLLAFFSASPTTTSYTMATQMDSDSDLACSCLVFSTALVTPVMFLWIFIFKTLGAF